MWQLRWMREACDDTRSRKSSKKSLPADPREVMNACPHYGKGRVYRSWIPTKYGERGRSVEN